jgi:hypothetical protein
MLWQRGKAYSQDLRERVLAAADDGELVGHIAVLLRVSIDSSSVSRDQPESDDACQNETYTEHSHRRDGIAQYRHSQNRGAGCADASPYRIASPDGQCAERERKKKDARQAGDDRQ